MQQLKFIKKFLSFLTWVLTLPLSLVLGPLHHSLARRQRRNFTAKDEDGRREQISAEQNSQRSAKLSKWLRHSPTSRRQQGIIQADHVDQTYRRRVDSHTSLCELQTNPELSPLMCELRASNHYSEWESIAQRIDLITGGVAWSDDSNDGSCNAKLLSEYTSRLAAFRKQGDAQSLMFSLRACLSRSFGGITSPLIYNHRLSGTKTVVTEFLAETVKSLHFLSETSFSSVGIDAKLAWFTEARHAHGKTALLLSGGASFGQYHLGVLKALWEAGQLPRVIAGSSAGSIVASLLAVRSPSELPGIWNGGLKMEYFDSHKSVSRKLKRLVTTGRLMDVSKLSSALRQNIGEWTFREAYERSGLVLNITVSPTNSWDPPMLLNHLTSPHILVWSAAAASCAFPLLYDPVQLKAKDGKGNVVNALSEDCRARDGSIAHDLPFERMAELFNIQNFIVSQVNPHVLPFLQTPEPCCRVSKIGSSAGNNGMSNLRKPSIIRRWFVSELRHRMFQLMEIGLLPASVWGVFTQRYTGHVTVVPRVSLGEYKNIIANPTPERISKCVQKAQRWTWEHMPEIEHRCAVEKALDRCVSKLRSHGLKGMCSTPGETATDGPDFEDNDSKGMSKVPSWLVLNADDDS